MNHLENGHGMREVRGAHELAGNPVLWSFELRDGRYFTVLAHAYHIEGDELIFSLLFRGKPHFEVESLRLPLDLMPEGFD